MILQNQTPYRSTNQKHQPDSNTCLHSYVNNLTKKLNGQKHLDLTASARDIGTTNSQLRVEFNIPRQLSSRKNTARWPVRTRS